MTLPFDKLAITADELAITALQLVVMLVGMRLLYGAWPWEARKTWYRTRQAVTYVEALRGKKNAAPLHNHCRMQLITAAIVLIAA